MTVRVTLYTFTKKANSTKKPTSTTPKLETEGYIKSPSSLLNPVVELSVEPLAYQYAYIYEFSRYYFITDIVFNKGIWLVSLRVDVMGTYKTNIGASTSYILRAAASGKQNVDIIDTAFPITGKIETAVEGVASASPDTYNTGGYYLLTTTGASNTNGTTTYQMTPAEYKNFISTLMTTANGYNWGDFTQGLINSVMNPLDYISSVLWSPVAFPTSGTSTYIDLGLWQTPFAASIVYQSAYAETVTYSVTIPKHPQAASYGRYCNLAPFTEYYLDMGFMPIIKLDNSLLQDVATMAIMVKADPVTGMAWVWGYPVNVNEPDQPYIFKVNVQFCVPVPVTQTTTSLTGLTTSLVDLASSVITGDPVGAATNTLGMFASVTDAAVGVTTSAGSMGSIAGHQVQKALYAKFYQIATRDKTNMGVPYCAYVKPSTCSGYQKVANAHIALTAALNPEVNEINAIMEDGFYYE